MKNEVLIVVRDGVRVSFNANGSIDIHGSVAVSRHPVLNQNAEEEIGAVMEDGKIFAGFSPTTGDKIFVTPKNAPRVMRKKTAVEYAARLEFGGYTDWRLPTRAELNVLYQNRNKGTFNDEIFRNLQCLPVVRRTI